MTHFAVHLKLKQYCKSTILQFKKKILRLPAVVQWVKDPELLQLWHRLEAAVRIQSLAQELPEAVSAAKIKFLKDSWVEHQGLIQAP